MRVYTALLFLLLLYASLPMYAQNTSNIAEDTIRRPARDPYFSSPYSPSTRPRYSLKDRYGDPFSARHSISHWRFTPSGYQRTLHYDTLQGYTLYERIGDVNYRSPTKLRMTPFRGYYQGASTRQYWKERSLALDGQSPVEGRLLVPKIYIGPWSDRIFGGSFVEFQPNIFLTVDLGSRWNRIANPALPVERQRTWLLDLNQQMNANVTGQVGEKLKVTFNYDTQAPFSSFNADLKNNLRVEYTGYEEEIFKKIELGNVSMVSENSLIRSSQSLFGIKTKLQFGRLYLTSLLSTQKGNQDNITTESGGLQARMFSIRMLEYEENRFFFLGHFFRDNYEAWLEDRPRISSGLNVTRVEVYVLNRGNEVQGLRNTLAFLDLGEGRVIHRPDNPRIGQGGNEVADNTSNRLYESLVSTSSIRDINNADNELQSAAFGLEKTIDYEKITSARKLNPNEYTVHAQLGYIKLSRRLQNDEVLAVSYEYTYNGARHKVGELSEDYQGLGGQAAIILKLLRPSLIDVESPSWRLSMRNVYDLGSAGVERAGFKLRIHYRDDQRGIDNPSLNEGRNVKDKPLVELLGIDRLDQNNEAIKDGVFDFIEGVTINSAEGYLIFPVLEPFGRTLRSHFDEDTEGELIDRYVFEEMYALTLADAQLITTKNKYTLQGQVQSSGSSSEIRLPAFGIIPNSVQVTAGGVPLVEGTDYTVDYSLGKVTILNESILNSGRPISVNYEKSDFLSTRTRTLIGNHLDYKLSDDVHLGATMMYLGEQQGGITRYQIGNEPVRNFKYGFNVSVDKETLWLTKGIDWLPLLNTKEPSRVRFNAEAAQLIPGTANRVGGESTFYIDDFESSATYTNLNNFRGWKMAATPPAFDRSTGGDPLGYAYHRAKLSWYNVDNNIYTSRVVSAGDLGPSGLSNHYVRSVPPQEIFPQRDVDLGIINESVFDVAYFPSERGPYNYTTDLTSEGLLATPGSNWGGISRAITNEVDFEKAGIEYLEFWLMDPFIGGEKGRVWDGIFNKNNTTGGELVFNLGNISEDVVPDGLHAFENGLPSDGNVLSATRTEWGYVTNRQFVTRAFDNNSTTRRNQDVGLDGVINDQEADFFKESYLDQLSISPEARVQVLEDVSADNFSYFLSNRFDAANAGILERYKDFNNVESNTPIASSSSDYVPIGSPYPDNEDLNMDNTISDREAYYEYSIPLRPNDLSIGRHHIVDEVEAGEARWYLFRVPVSEPDRTEGNLSNFKSIRFVRMYLTGFSEPVVLRFVKMRLVGSNWRKYEEELAEEGVMSNPNTGFDLSVVSLEENGSSSSPYVVPPGIERDQNDFSLNQQRLNEQSLQLCVDDLVDGDARAVFKNIQENLVNYQRLRMFFHAEGARVRDHEVEAFLRIGSDNSENYYEVIVPLKITPPTLSGGNIASQVWPSENEINISLNELYAVKLRRDREQSADLSTPYIDNIGRHKVKVLGRPKVSNLQVVMIGIRNPMSSDRGAQSACIWANELRMTGIERKSGWATQARLQTQLADFADVAVATRYSTPGFGDVQDKVQERTQEERFGYDASATVHLAHLLPWRTGLRVPMYVSYEEDISTPEYDPLDSDVPLEAALLSREGEERDRYERFTRERSTRRSLNFTNVGKDRLLADRRPRVYDVENLSFTYAYSDRVDTDINTARALSTQHRGAANYDFSGEERYLEPFQESSGLRSPYLQLVRDINVNLLPDTYSLGASLERRFQKTQLRNSELNTEGIDPTFEKLFTFSRTYGVGWNISRSLALNYDAQARAIIDEPLGDIDSEEKKRELWSKVWEGGRLSTFNQSVSADYMIPLEKIPPLRWVSSTARYAASYQWKTASQAQAATFGNDIQNTRERGITSSFNLQQLYGSTRVLRPPVAGDTASGQGFSKALVGIVTMLRNVSIDYTIQEQTVLPGFKPTATFLGLAPGFTAPGWAFVLGSQDPDIRIQAARNQWLIQNESLTTPFAQRSGKKLSLGAELTPFPSLRVQLNAQRSIEISYQEIFRYDPATDVYTSFSPSRRGLYSISFYSLSSAFGKEDAAFRDFEAYRQPVKTRLDAENTVGNYSANAQDILIPAFIAAYSGQDPQKVSLSPFPRIPLPNWSVSYTGLSELSFLKEVFSGITLSHAYASTYAIGNFSSSLLYTDGLDLSGSLLDYPLADKTENESLVPFYIINSVAISEDFSPLIGINFAFANRMSLGMNWRKGRMASLSLSNGQVNEARNNDYNIDYSYSIERFRIPIQLFGTGSVLNNTLTLRAGIGWRVQQDVQRILDQDSFETGGDSGLQFKASADYMLNQFLNFQVYFDRSANTPRVSTAFRRSNTSFGFRLQVNWSQ